jgi:hypothetical protein
MNRRIDPQIIDSLPKDTDEDVVIFGRIEEISSLSRELETTDTAEGRRALFDAMESLISEYPEHWTVRSLAYVIYAKFKEDAKKLEQIAILLALFPRDETGLRMLLTHLGTRASTKLREKLDV